MWIKHCTVDHLNIRVYMSVLVTYIFGKDMDHGKAFQSVDDLIPENYTTIF